eukprot:9136353-Pyramimonas_sp.AAC.1
MNPPPPDRARAKEEDKRRRKGGGGGRREERKRERQGQDARRAPGAAPEAPQGAFSADPYNPCGALDT